MMSALGLGGGCYITDFALELHLDGRARQLVHNLQAVVIHSHVHGSLACKLSTKQAQFLISHVALQACCLNSVPTHVIECTNGMD